MPTNQQLRRAPILHEKGVWIMISIPALVALAIGLVMLRLGSSGRPIPAEPAAISNTASQLTPALPIPTTSDFVSISNFGSCQLRADVTNPTQETMTILLRSDAGTLRYTIPALEARRYSLDYYTTSLAVLNEATNAPLATFGPANAACLGETSFIASIRTPAEARALTRVTAISH